MEHYSFDKDGKLLPVPTKTASVQYVVKCSKYKHDAVEVANLYLPMFNTHKEAAQYVATLDYADGVNYISIIKVTIWSKQ